MLTVIFLFILLVVVFSLVSSNYFKNFGFKLRYSSYSFSGTPEKMDALNKESIENSKKDGKSVAILLHGAGTEYYKDVYGTALWFEGMGVNVVSFDYDFKAPPDESAQKLSSFVAEILNETKAEKINIIGICLGGVIARYYAEKFNGAEHIDKLVTIISPATFIPKTAAAYQYDKWFSFDPDPWNQVLRYLQNKNPVEEHLYLYCKKDSIIPAKYQFSSKGNFIGLNCGHAFINVNPEILDPTLDFINKN